MLDGAILGGIIDVFWGSDVDFGIVWFVLVAGLGG